MLSADTYTGTPALVQIAATVLIAEATVLSMGMKIPSTLPASAVMALCTSDTDDTPLTSYEMPLPSRYCFASSITVWLLTSLRQ